MAKEEKAAAPVEDMDWEGESTDGLYKFDTVGQKVTGLLRQKKMVNGDYKPYMICDIQTADTELHVPCTSSLTDELKKIQYQPNTTIVEIELVELKPTGKKEPFKRFKVRSARATETRLAQLGIQNFDSEETTGDDAQS